MSQETPVKHKRKSRRRSQTVTSSNDNVNNNTSSRPQTPSQPISKSKHRDSKRKSSSKSSKHRKSSIDSSTPTIPSSSSRSNNKRSIHRRRAHSDAPTQLQASASSYHRSLINNNNNDEDEFDLGAAYGKGDIVLTKDSGSNMCIIKTKRSQNGLQYGIIIPPESNIRYIKPAKITQKIAAESVIARVSTLEKALVKLHNNKDTFLRFCVFYNAIFGNYWHSIFILYCFQCVLLFFFFFAKILK